ncbi:MAG: hypothetical protein MMC23_000641 [Stictis urceolatum]|nr:hypothetical protein [Stictis urceolata]
MTAQHDLPATLRDILEALRLVAVLNYQRTLVSWLYVPVGLVLILLACWGVDCLIHISSVSFPASVALLVVLFAFLNLSQWLLGDRRTKAVVKVLDIPTDFALRWINVFFVPAFVLLPLSPSIDGTEIGKIIGVFVIGFFVFLAATAYTVRGLQLLTGSSKRAIVSGAEEMGTERDEIPLTEPPQSTTTSSEPPTPASTSSASLPGIPPATYQAPLSPSEPTSNQVLPALSLQRQSTLLLTPLQRYAAFLSNHLDSLTYTTLLLTLGLPLYYTHTTSTPLHLALTVLTYHLAISLPPTYLRLLHPVLLSAGLTIFLIWTVGLTQGHSLHQTLHTYSTGTKYIQLLTPSLAAGKPGPGAGDVLSSVLDASIVALAMPMFQHRRSLRAHFVAIMVPSISLAVGSLLGYPPLCAALGIRPSRSLTFAVRSLTLALAQPAAGNLGVEDTSFVALLCILSGILGALVGPRFLRWIGVPDEDHVTRGVALGVSGSAIATARLLREDPRAAALGSLSLGVFGGGMVGLTSVPAVVGFVRGLVGA